MKDRIARYIPYTDEESKKPIILQSGQKCESVICLDAKDFHKKSGGAKPVGYVHQKNRSYSGKGYAALTGVGEEYYDVYPNKKFYEKVIAYICTDEGEFIGVTKSNALIPIVIGAAVVGVAVAGVLLFRPAEEDTSVIAAGQVIEQTNPDEETNYCLFADVIIPAGSVTFDGTIYAPEDEQKYIDDQSYEGTAYTGTADTEVSMITESGEHILLYKWTSDITDGALAPTELDFTKLDFEVTSGIYEGSMDITYDDGTELTVPMQILVRSTIGGSMSLGYSDQVAVDLASQSMTLHYSLSDAPQDTYVEVIIQDGENEYVIGRSDPIHSGETLSALPLESDMVSRLEAGSYSGVIRVYVVAADDSEAAADLHTDIEATIIVE